MRGVEVETGEGVAAGSPGVNGVALAEAMRKQGWSIGREVETLVALIRCADAEVSMRATGALLELLRQVREVERAGGLEAYRSQRARGRRK